MNKSIIKEAITEYNEIMEAANINAKNQLANEFPDKYSNLLKEELKKNKSAKESYKKIDESEESTSIDETELNNESVMNNQKNETTKVVKETAGEGKPFGEKAKQVGKVEETAGAGKPFGGKINKPLQTEEFDITELDVSSVGSALEGADGLDEVLTMEEIEREISEMEGISEELKGIEPNSPSYMEKGNKGIAFNELINMRNTLDEMIKNSGVNEMHQGKFDLNKMHQGAYDSKLVDETNVDEMHQGKFDLNKMHQGAYDSKLVDEEAITDADIESVLGSGNQQQGQQQSQPQQEGLNYEEEGVDEAHGMAYSSRRQNAGRHLPGEEYLSQGELDQAPYLKESQKKISALINENKNLTKKINETKKYKQTVEPLLESYKSALDKYRTQLKEMAVFNTNLAHVNNLLVNEELALTQEDKIKIINEFKQINTITDSQKKYKNFLTEMKETRKTISESIEAKVTTSVQPSSKQKLDEVVEKTVYADNQHINKMKKLIEYVEKRGNKK